MLNKIFFSFPGAFFFGNSINENSAGVDDLKKLPIGKKLDRIHYLSIFMGKKEGRKKMWIYELSEHIFFFIKWGKTGDLDVNLKCCLLSLNKVFQIPMPFYQSMQLKSLEKQNIFIMSDIKCFYSGNLCVYSCQLERIVCESWKLDFISELRWKGNDMMVDF